MVVPLIIAGQAIIHGLRIAGLRVIPYIIREATKKSAKSYVTKKVGQKSITETGYVIVTKDPTKFKLAQKIFGKNKVFRNESVLQAQSTASKEIVPVSQKILKSASPEVRTTILKQADDAASSVSKFVSSSKVQTVGGTKIAEPFKQFFGKNLQFSKNTTELIKVAERGPASLSKEIAVTAAPTVAKETIKKTPEVIKLGQKVAKVDKTVPIKQVIKTEKRPWYVSVMPPFLRTTKDVRILGPDKLPYGKGGPFSIRTVKDVVAKKKLASTIGVGVGLDQGRRYMASNMDDTDEFRGGIDLSDSDLFATESQDYAQEDIASSVDVFDTDEQGDIIQAQ